MSFTRPLLLGPVFFWTALPCSGQYHLESGAMPLHDAVGINCKKGATIQNERAEAFPQRVFRLTPGYPG